ncbi:hypothetical protein CASFOL_002921 [Castilleja foliolosa]|uniref:Uncharacterized protein n=1 Tax=Castilleja foliolosa TaxID=1961234 RepID=A0ABD3EG20_9LAMI
MDGWIKAESYNVQKQYFEQRKRQQLQQTVGLESYADRRPSCIENSRSLDILSLVNVSAAAQGSETCCLNEDKSEDHDFTLDHQYILPYQAMLDDEGLHVDQTEINEERALSSYGTEAEYSDKVSSHLPDYNEDLVGSGNKKLDPSKLSVSHSEISLMDLLSDSGANNNAEEYSTHMQEPHVAFSIAGLGKVEQETPPHSPKIPGRFTPNMDVVRQEDGFSPYDSPIEQTFLSKDTMDIIDNPNMMFSNRRCSSPFNWGGSNSQVSFENDELVYNIRDSRRNIWDDFCPSYLDDSIDDLGERETFCKNWANQRSVPYEDYFRNSDLWKQSVSFDGWNLQKKRFSAERSENIDIRELPVPYPKHQTTGDLSYEIHNTRYSAITIDDDVKEAVNHFVREDNSESLSLLSRGDATRKS